MKYNRSIVDDIKAILDKRDVPFFFDDIFGCYLEDIGYQEEESCEEENTILENIASSYKSGRRLPADGKNIYNMYPSKLKGDLKNFFVGICHWNDKIENVFKEFSKWSRQHSERKTVGMKYAVILTELWDPKTYKKYEDLIRISLNCMDLKIVFILVADNGASEIKVI